MTTFTIRLPQHQARLVALAVSYHLSRRGSESDPASMRAYPPGLADVLPLFDAGIEEGGGLAPDRPIRFIVPTHHPWDHLGGLRTYVHEGATVITHAGNRAYYQAVLRARPWLLDPDRFSLSPPEEWSEGYIFETVGEKYILGDEGRTVELHHVQGLNHVAGMLIAYFPKEKLVVEADLYTPPPPGDQSARTPSRQQQDLL